MKRELLMIALLSLGACTVGPDFAEPAVDLPARWGKEVGSQASLDPVDKHWWQQLEDPQLTSLVEQARNGNLDIRAAMSRLEQSRLVLKVTRGDELPSIGASGSYQRARNSGNGLSDASKQDGRSPYELWGGALDASWEVDLWGRVSRLVESANAQVEVTKAESDGVMLSIAADTASNYIRLRGVQARLAVARQNLEIAKQTQTLTQTRFDNGVTTNLDTANSGALVATITATIPVLEADQARLINAISFLVGKAPRALRDELIEPKGIPNPAPDVPLGLPSELEKRRPDIRASEAALHRAVAAIGVAKADFYPRVSLGASFGFQSLNGSDLGDWGSRQWSYGPSLYLPIFQGGRLTGTLELRNAQSQEAAITYQKVVLNAWHEVDTAVTDYAAEKTHHKSLMGAVRQNNIALATARNRYSQGASDFINVLSVQRALLDTQSALVDSATQAALDRVRLYRALGGGWPEA
ncbi:efflux transporter outer membrane subunit [Pseudomonas putida]|uniref:efflux transporter outer membrane subunit n=1 Tax=Pseudomonas putida TaxID=303 RepID=UPI000E0CFDAB|nr:efflux transporter outer membrane subunit [Pseudomonas putida]MCI1037704.1 efflux transporter outer membrane subunit [Pseudomonas putida]WQE52189.1 efflux transporter outer membrane subunit [Pseudomonas putida]GLO05678.1 hypothetical protein PPUJ13061_55820 [Pseudomonas putida]HDS1009107.1 efflux transporter outer membrane subunit [Pseudomonas putida]